MTQEATLLLNAYSMIEYIPAFCIVCKLTTLRHHSIREVPKLRYRSLK
ncbi:hypothetical protein VSVS05_03137 [Vibrio scophthalmi]|uniref:Uncharacterized protein n=1 Tax=Vibrio scophthalmi TaxID=45658 RepID=A0A1C7FDQ4_9VIBR|nr:hypothetical protein VSVS05_03137 [Vibrio scophthalmi]